MLFKHKTFVYFSRKVPRNLAFEYFISKKTLKSVVQGKKVSKPIVRISVISIALAVIVNLITIAVVTGFQQEVRQKVSGFGSHIFIMEASENSIYESDPIQRDQSFLADLQSDPGIKSISAVGYKPVLLQSEEREISYKLASGKDTVENQYQVHGAVIKGVGEDYNWAFFESYLLNGILPDYSQDSCENHLVISRKLAADLNYEVGDRVSAFFVKQQPVKRKFKIAGIYETGLEEFDKQIVLGSLSSVQQLNDWGIKASIQIADTIIDGQIVVEADVSGGNGYNYRYDWGRGFDQYSGFTICPHQDTTIRLIATDYWTNPREDISESAIPDTAYMKITVQEGGDYRCYFELNEEGEIEREPLNDEGTTYALDDGTKRLIVETTDGKGSYDGYISGFEIMVKDWSQLDEVLARTKGRVELILMPNGEVLKATSIIENEPDIFVWLGFLDLNVIIILVLMILIGIINMGSALLVLILIRSNFIGMMKAMGATNWSLRKIFLIQAGFLIGRGMLWGNLIGLGICLAQKYFGLIPLDPEVYYLSQVPIEINVWHWILLNIGTLVVCLSALIIPSMVIARINPVKAIKFN
ncbi:MAG: ABC transporter permease [Crocinitomicaceae bacterium]|nr:ABC transporter permease [Crocinitomicaceae bacterium]